MATRRDDGWDLTTALRSLRDADPAAPMVADGAGGELSRDAFWRIACGVSQAAAAAPGGAFALLPPAGATGQAWIAGALMAGRPFALLDARDPPERREDIRAALGLGAWLAAAGTALPPGAAPLPPPAEADTPAATAGGPEEPAVMVPTSGSTGRPKGIVQSRRGILFRADAIGREYGFGDGAVYLSTAADGSISGLVHGFAALLSGALLLRVDPARIGLAGVLRAAEAAGGVTALQGLPAVLTALLGAPGAAKALGDITHCQSSGAQLLAADVQALRAALPSGCRLVNVYGLTEAPALLRWDVPAGWQPDGPRIPAGQAIAEHRIEIVDEAGRPVPPGEVGELVGSGPTIALGEWVDGRLVEVPRIAPVPGGRRLRTGDLARLRPDGLYEIVGRADRQVKIGGRRVELEEIEDRLRRAPGVALAAVIADRDAAGGPRIHAAVEAAPDAPPGLEEALWRDLRVALPGYMLPARLLVLPELPRLPGGKVDSRALLERIRAAAPPAAAAVSLDPRVARAWRRALHAPPAADLSFRNAGGDSLGFLVLALELERATGHGAVLSVLHEGMTAAEMSAALAAPRRAGRGARVLLLPGNGGDSEPLARLREGCPELDFVTLRYPSWRDFARRGAEVAVDAQLVLDQALDAFAEGQPPILLGHSYGAAVGHELARLMAARGRPVRGLLVLDCGPLAPADAVAVREGTAAPRETAGEGLLRRLRWQFRRAGQTPPRARWAARLLPAEPPPGVLALRLWRELDLSLRENAIRRWFGLPAERTAVPAVLFLSEAERPGVPRDLGWAARCDLREIVPVGGDHLGMIRPPHRAALCAAISRRVLEMAAA